ncbi:outer membrane protein assembly factor BamB [Deinobacterium chartae]|uniref:Outer membrane protein assembly factor BamB n=1 Tax=Deinobacterium chartae TaxID=521158 RepID=A0A841I039_9DEIO|nr:PQQ-like beta-propeller repeat protein [Deinobacterium chartae]MBB6097492.1 outer membrane protein assembly factor BamB [Deinobacterium chartae]
MRLPPAVLALSLPLLLAACSRITPSPGSPQGPDPHPNPPQPPSALEQRRFGTLEPLGTPVAGNIAVFNSALTLREGRPLVLMVVQGPQDGTLNVLDARSNTVLETYTLEGGKNAWSSTVTPDGRVHIGAHDRLFTYDPTRRTVTAHGNPLGEGSIWAMTSDEQGRVYGGTFPGGKVFELDPDTGSVREIADLSNPAAPQSYVRSLTYRQGKLYAGTGTLPRIVEIELASGAQRSIELPPIEGLQGKAEFVYGLAARGKYLFAYVNTAPSPLLVYDLEDEAWEALQFNGHPGLDVSPEKNGKVYFLQGGKLQELDLATLEKRTLEAVSYSSSYRFGGWADLEDPSLPGESLLTVSYGGSMVALNPQAGARILPIRVQGSPAQIQSLVAGEDGQSLYMGGYLSSRATRYDVQSRSATLIPMEQAENIAVSGSDVFFGTYPKAHIFHYRANEPVATGSNPKKLFQVLEEQDRPYGMAANERYVVAGTLPTYGQLGGALSVFDRRSGSLKTYRNIIPGHSVISVVIKGDTVYASTTVNGGLGSTPTETEARVLRFDIASGQLLKQTTVDLPGAPDPIYIGNIRLGPDGLLWGVADGSVFALDPQTLELRRHRTLYPEISKFGLFRPMFVGFQGGVIYSNLGTKLTAIDHATLEFRKLADDVGLAALGPDGNLYFTHGPNEAQLWTIDVE